MLRLFYVSEESNILHFIPRNPTRTDLKNNTPLVWAIDEEHLPNYLLPRNCPRVCYKVNEHTSEEDKSSFQMQVNEHHVAIERVWLEKLRQTSLYLYEFDPKNFEPQDKNAGYYASTLTEEPIRTFILNNLEDEFVKRGVRLRLVEHLLPLSEAIAKSSFEFSIIRINFANNLVE